MNFTNLKTQEKSKNSKKKKIKKKRKQEKRKRGLQEYTPRRLKKMILQKETLQEIVQHSRPEKNRF